MANDQDSGESTPDSLASYDPASRSWKTSARSLFEDSTAFAGTWPTSGMTRSGRLYARRTWVRPIAERGCSLWLTPSTVSPTASCNNGSNAGRPSTGKSLMRQATVEWPTPRSEDSECSGARIARGTVDTLTAKARQEWPTPQTTDANSAARHTTTTGVMHPGTTLTDAMRAQDQPAWLTPQSRDHKGISQKVAKGEFTGSLCDQIAGMRSPAGPPDPANHSTCGSRPVVLNPRWVAALMGFPVDWLDGVEPPSKRSGTRSCRKSLKSSPDTSSR